MISVDYEQVVYNGNGSQTAWPYSFPIYDGDVVRLILLDADGTETDITQDYFVDVPGSTVYYPGYAPGEEPPVADQPPKVQTGQKLIVYRDTEITQDSDLGDSWPFNVIEKGLDKLTMILQEKAFTLARCLKISQGQAAEIDNYDPTVPLAADKVICGNAAGDGFEAREALMEVNGAWDGEGRQIHSVADPTADQDAVTKKYADNRMDSNFMKLQPDGEAWEGRNIPISNVANPVSVHDSATKDYVDRILNGFVLAGDSRTVPFDTVAQMLASDIEVGQIAYTLGYNDVNDGAGANYLIRTKTVSDVDDYNNFTLDNGLFAERIYSNTFDVVKGDTVQGWKVYTSVTSLGLTYSTVTLDQIFRAMPNHSKAILYITMGATSFRRNPLPYYGTNPYYYGYGVLTITKHAIGNIYAPIAHCEFRDEARNNKQRIWTGEFIGTYNADNPQITDYKWTGWEEVNAKPIDVPKNPQRCVDEFVAVAESYYNKGISYGIVSAGKDNGTIEGFSGTATDMSCRLFVASVMEGIPYEMSKWYNSSNPLRYVDAYSWAMHPPSDWYEFIKWCWQNGWEVDPGIDYGNLQKGDIVFWGGGFDRWGDGPTTDEDGQPIPSEDSQDNYENGVYSDTHTNYWKSYRAVSHVGIVTGKWYTDSQGNKQPAVIQCTGWGSALPIDPLTSNGVRYDYIGSLNIPSHAQQYIVMVIRMPMCDSKAYSTTDYDSYVLGRKVVMSHYHKADITIKGNGSNVYIDVFGRNLPVYDEIEIGGISSLTGEDVAVTHRLRTGFVPYTGATDTVTPAGYTAVATNYYDKDKAFEGQSPPTANSVYMRRVYKKDDESDISSGDLNTFRNGYVWVNQPDSTAWEKGVGKSIKIDSAKIPNGYVCKQHNGEYCISNDGFNWTALDNTTQTALESIYLYDGQNNIRVMGGQDVEIL